MKIAFVPSRYVELVDGDLEESRRNSRVPECLIYKHQLGSCSCLPSRA